MGKTRNDMRALGIALAAVGIFALAGCSSTGGGATSGTSGGKASGTPTGTPTAQSILAQTKQANLNDATFTLTESITSTAGTLNANGNGTMTTSPFRQDLKLSSNVGGQPAQAEIITDNTTVYTKTAGQAKWTEASGAATGATVSPSLNNIANLPGATLVGTDTFNGVSAYHLRGAGSQSASGQSVAYSEDLWVNKANSQPVKVTYHVTSAQGSVDRNRPPQASGLESQSSGGLAVTSALASPPGVWYTRSNDSLVYGTLAGRPDISRVPLSPERFGGDTAVA